MTAFRALGPISLVCGCAVLAAAFPVASRAQGYTPSADIAQVGLPDAASARQLLDGFRASFNAEPYYLEFDLHILPRRGDERVVRGTLWAHRDASGPVSRISFPGPDGKVRRILVQGGEASTAWVYDGAGVAASDPGALLKPLVPGVEATAFDLQMTFLYWNDAKLMSIERIRGRPAYGFVFRPPAEFALQHPEIGSVRAYLDTQYNAPVEFDVRDPKGRVTQTWSLLDLKKVGERWIPKEIDIRNETTRDKTRFVVTGAAIGAHPEPSVFDPARLSEEAPSPPRDHITATGS